MKDRRIVIGVIVFSAIIIIGLGVGFGLASTKSSTSTDKNSGVQTTTQQPTTSPTTPTNSPYPTPGANAGNGNYTNGAVATDAGKCSEIGRDILKKGGSAVDAAIASSLCIGVVNMHSAGIGGGAFMLVYNKANGTAETLDYREEAPKLATQDMFQNISSTKGIQFFNRFYFALTFEYFCLGALMIAYVQPLPSPPSKRNRLRIPS